MTEFGATVGQSVGGHLVVASRLKLVRAGVVEAPGSSTGADALEGASAIEVSRETHSALDFGVMVPFPHVRVGLSLMNVNEPEFGDKRQAFQLSRQARAGLALLSSGRGPIDALIVSADADLTTEETVLGKVRHAAAGAEAWVFGRRVGLRGRVSANTLGDASFTTSVGLTSGLFADAALTMGPDRSRTGWATAMRLAF